MYIIESKSINNRLKIAFWILEIIELILAIITVGITSSASSGMTSDLGFKSIPGKLAYNIAVVSNNRNFPREPCKINRPAIIRLS